MIRRTQLTLGLLRCHFAGRSPLSAVQMVPTYPTVRAHLLFPIILVGCGTSSQPADKDNAASRPNSDSGGAVLQPAGPSDTGRHARLLAQMFRADANAHRKTFGFTPPDSAAISLVTDAELYHKADRALDSTLIAMGGTKKNDSSEKGSLYVYRAGDVYAVVDVNQQFGHATANLPIFFFFDSRWRYLGFRSN
jgi:hypothetical protein